MNAARIKQNILILQKKYLIYKERGQNGSSAIIHNRFEVIFARSKITKTSKEPAIPPVFEFLDKTFLTLNLCAYLWKLFHPLS